MLFRIPNIWSGPRPVLHESGSFIVLESGFYRDFDPAYLPVAMIDLPQTERHHGARLVFEARHILFYPSRIAGTDEDGRIWFTYNHPGHLPRLQSYSRGARPPLILAAGTNDLLGPRSVVAALETGERGPGQGPPYTGLLTQREEAVWYLFLPFDADFDTRFSLEGDIGVVEMEQRAPFRFHAATGIPVEAGDRGGLSEERWNARRNGLLAALFKASARDQGGDPGAGARILEEFAGVGGGSPELVSIPLYRAALLRMRETALEQALDDVRRAVSIETRPATPPAYLFLEADILIRLDRKQEARELLDTWLAGPTERSRLYYGWLLLCWRAGADPSRGRLLSGVPEEDRGEWSSLIRIAFAAHHADLAAGRPAAEELNSMPIQWDSQHYWAARLYLDAPDPDPGAALAHLDRARDSFRTGVHVPLAAARLHARLVRNPADRPSAAEIDAARQDLEETADCAATSAECLTLLEFGERDLAAAGRVRRGTNRGRVGSDTRPGPRRAGAAQ